MTFNLCKEGTNEVIMGPLNEDNVYLTAYGAVQPDHKAPKDLEIGETTRMRYALSGQRPTIYTIVRIS